MLTDSGSVRKLLDEMTREELLSQAKAYMTALEKAEKDISFALGSVLTDAALLEDLREEIRKVLP